MEDSFAHGHGHNESSSTTPFSFMNVHKQEDLLPFLPTQYQYRFQNFKTLEDERVAETDPEKELDSSWFRAEIRFKAYVPNELVQWQESFQRITRTKWIKTGLTKTQDGKGKRVLFRSTLVCQHSKKNKVKEYKRVQKQKNMHCTASILLRLRRDSEAAKKRDPYYGYFGHVTIKWTHSHPVASAQSLSYLRNPHLQELFENEYFEKGLTSSGALRARIEHLQTLSGFDPSWIDNRGICPDRHQVWHWYNNWRKTFPHPLPEPIPTKPNKVSRSKRDDLLSKVANQLTEKLSFLSGNPSNLEVDTLKSLSECLEKVKTKQQLLLTLKSAANVQFDAEMPKLRPSQSPKRKLKLVPQDVGLGPSSSHKKRRSGGMPRLTHRRRSSSSRSPSPVFEEQFVGIDIDI